MTHAKHNGLALGFGDHHQVARREGNLGFIRGRPRHFSSLRPRLGPKHNVQIARPNVMHLQVALSGGRRISGLEELLKRGTCN